MKLFIFAIYLLAITVGFPTDVIQNVTRIDTPIITKNNQGTRIQRTFPKPRISVTNMYRSSPFIANQVNPIENLLLYLLLTAGRDFSEEEQLEQQREENRRRSPDLFGDFISEFNKATVKIANGTKTSLDKFEDILGKPSKDSEQESHNHPIASEGSCMCFNRVFRTRQNRHFEPIIRRISDTKSLKINALQSVRKTTASAGGWKSNHTTREDVTQQSQQVLDDSLTKSAENGTRDYSPATVRVLRVADLIEDVKNGSPSPSRSSPLSHDIDDDLILELQQGANEDSGGTKKYTDLQPPWLESIRAAEKVAPCFRQTKETLQRQPTSEIVRRATTTNDTNASTDKTEDDGYYFLLYSGGTDKRTTASTEPREQIYDEENTEEELKPPPFGPFRRLQQIADKTTPKVQRMQTTTKSVDGSKKLASKDTLLSKTRLDNDTKLVSELSNLTTTGYHANKVWESKEKRDESLRKKSKTVGGDAKKRQNDEDDKDSNVSDEGAAKDKFKPGASPVGASKDTDQSTEEQPKPQKSPDKPPAARNQTDEAAKPPASEGEKPPASGEKPDGGDDGPKGNETTTEKEEETPDPNLTKDKDSGNQNFMIVAIPTALGLLIIVAICCYCTRPNGSFCYNFLRKPGQPTLKQKRAAEAADKADRAEMAASQRKTALKAQSEQKKQERIKFDEQKEKDRMRKIAQQERDRARAAIEKEKKLEAQRKQREKDLVRKEAERIKREEEKVRRDEEKAKRNEELAKQRERDKAAREAERARREAARAKVEQEKKALEKAKQADEEPIGRTPKKQVPRPGTLS